MADFVPFAAEGVRGFLHRPEGAAADGLVLTHGAGGDCRTPLLIAAADAFRAAGLAVLRCDLPFRQRRPSGPPSPSTAAADRAGLRDAVAAMRGKRRGTRLPRRPIVWRAPGDAPRGGGAGRCGGSAPAVLSSAPPGKPAQLRIGHFPNISVPAVFVHGTSDPFGTIAENRGGDPADPRSDPPHPPRGRRPRPEAWTLRLGAGRGRIPGVRSLNATPSGAKAGTLSRSCRSSRRRSGSRSGRPAAR